jgi:hypothetical protein
VNILGAARFKLEGKNDLGDLGINGIILQWVLEKKMLVELPQNRDQHQPLVNVVMNSSTKFPII